MPQMPRTSSPLDLLVALHRGAAPLHAQLEAQLRDGGARRAPGRRLRACRPRARSQASWASRAVWSSRRTASSRPRGTSPSRRGAAPVVGAIAAGAGRSAAHRAAPRLAAPRPAPRRARPRRVPPRRVGRCAAPRPARRCRMPRSAIPTRPGIRGCAPRSPAYLGRVRGVRAAPGSRRGLRRGRRGAAADAAPCWAPAALPVDRRRGSVARRDPAPARPWRARRRSPSPVDAHGLDPARDPAPARPPCSSRPPTTSPPAS